MWREDGCGGRVVDVEEGCMWREGGGFEWRVVDVEGDNTSATGIIIIATGVTLSTYSLACSRYTLLATCSTPTTVFSDDDNNVSTGAILITWAMLLVFMELLELL